MGIYSLLLVLLKKIPFIQTITLFIGYVRQLINGISILPTLQQIYSNSTRKTLSTTSPKSQEMRFKIGDVVYFKNNPTPHLILDVWGGLYVIHTRERVNNYNIYGMNFFTPFYFGEYELIGFTSDHFDRKL